MARNCRFAPTWINLRHGFRSARTIAHTMEPLITDRAVAEIVGVSTRTLRFWRQHQKGPPFVRLSKKSVRYRRTDVDAWIAAQIDPAMARRLAQVQQIHESFAKASEASEGSGE